MTRGCKVLAAGLLALGVAAGARAEVEFGAGPVDEIGGEGSAVVTLAFVTADPHPWEFLVGHLASRDTGPATPSTTFLAVSKRLTWRRLFASSGLAVVDVENEVLSSAHQFFTGLGYDGGRWTVTLRHLSNANTGGRNRGETFLLASWAF